MTDYTSNLLLCNNIKIFLISWWIFLLFTILLWYRNYSYDRIWAPYLLVLGVIMILQYGYLAGGNSQQIGRLIFLSIWLSLLVLAIGTMVMASNRFSFFTLMIVALVFLISIFVSFSDESLDLEGYQWYLHVEDWIWLYVLLFTLIIISMLISFGRQVGLIIIYLYFLASLLGVYFYYVKTSRYVVYTYWFLWLVGLPFIIWLLGLSSI